MAVTIWHNPRCSTSRGALALIREAGIEPAVVDYLADPPDAATLRAVLDKAGLAASGLIRSKEALYAELGLGEADEAALLAAMVAHPQLINRPVVITGTGAALCRPSETVRALL